MKKPSTAMIPRPQIRRLWNALRELVEMNRRLDPTDDNSAKCALLSAC